MQEERIPFQLFSIKSFCIPARRNITTNPQELLAIIGVLEQCLFQIKEKLTFVPVCVPGMQIIVWSN